MYFGKKHRNRSSLVMRSLILTLAISTLVLFQLTPPGLVTKTADAGCFVLTDSCDVVGGTDVCLGFASQSEWDYDVAVSLASGVGTSGSCGGGSVQVIETFPSGVPFSYHSDGHGGVLPYVLVFGVTPGGSFSATLRVTGYSSGGDPIKGVICVNVNGSLFDPSSLQCYGYSCSETACS